MAVLTKTTNIFVSSDRERRHALEVLNRTSVPPKSVIDRLNEAMKVQVREEIFTDAR